MQTEVQTLRGTESRTPLHGGGEPPTPTRPCGPPRTATEKGPALVAHAGARARPGSALAPPAIGAFAQLGTEPATVSPAASAGPGHPQLAFTPSTSFRPAMWRKWPGSGSGSKPGRRSREDAQATRELTPLIPTLQPPPLLLPTPCLETQSSCRTNNPAAGKGRVQILSSSPPSPFRGRYLFFSGFDFTFLKGQGPLQPMGRYTRGKKKISRRIY